MLRLAQDDTMGTKDQHATRRRIEYNFYVYVLADMWRTICVGVTDRLERRVWEHKNKAVPGFTARYGLDRLVYFEHYSDIRQAIAREKRVA
jgi:putative endonuclease